MPSNPVLTCFDRQRARNASLPTLLCTDKSSRNDFFHEVALKKSIQKEKIDIDYAQKILSDIPNIQKYLSLSIPTESYPIILCEKGKDKVKSAIDMGSVCDIGGRAYNEDRSLVIYNLEEHLGLSGANANDTATNANETATNANETEASSSNETETASSASKSVSSKINGTISISGVFDGHGGVTCVNFFQQNFASIFYEMITRPRKKKFKNFIKLLKISLEETIVLLEMVAKKILFEDYELKRSSSVVSNELAAADLNKHTSGTTVALSVMYFNGTSLDVLVLNIGDSEIYGINNKNIKKLSELHALKVDDQFIHNTVSSPLQVTRAIGDFLYHDPADIRPASRPDSRPDNLCEPNPHQYLQKNKLWSCSFKPFIDHHHIPNIMSEDCAMNMLCMFTDGVVDNYIGKEMELCRKARRLSKKISNDNNGSSNPSQQSQPPRLIKVLATPQGKSAVESNEENRDLTTIAKRIVGEINRFNTYHDNLTLNLIRIGSWI